METRTNMWQFMDDYQKFSCYISGYLEHEGCMYEDDSEFRFIVNAVDARILEKYGTYFPSGTEPIQYYYAAMKKVILKRENLELIPFVEDFDRNIIFHH